MSDVLYYTPQILTPSNTDVCSLALTNDLYVPTGKTYRRIVTYSPSACTALTFCLGMRPCRTSLAAVPVLMCIGLLRCSWGSVGALTVSEVNPSPLLGLTFNLSFLRFEHERAQDLRPRSPIGAPRDLSV